MDTISISGRDRAVLRAVAAGRCQLATGCEPVLFVDGLGCADSGAGYRLVTAGLILPSDPARSVGPARLAPAGIEILRRAAR